MVGIRNQKPMQPKVRPQRSPVAPKPPADPTAAPAGVTPSPTVETPGLPSAAAQKTVGTPAKGPGVGAVLGQVGNALSMRLGLMTGRGQVASTSDALAALRKALESGQVPSSLPLTALDQLPIPPSGLVLQLDGGQVAGQRVVIRKIHDPESGPGLEIRFKLRTTEDMKQVADRMKAAGGTEGALVSEKMERQEDGRLALNKDAAAGYTFQAASTGTYASSHSQAPANAAILEAPGSYHVGVLGEDAAQAIRGTVRIRVFEGEQAKNLNANLATVLEKTGLGSALAPSDDDTRTRMNQMRMLWQTAPQKAQELADKNLDGTAMQAELQAALQSAGVDADAAAGLATKEVFPGHFAPVDPTQGERYRSLGVEYLFSGVRKLESVVAILEGDGLMSTNERYARGMIIAGASSASDIGSGGADYVFTRMVSKDAAGKSLSSAFSAGDYQFVFSPELLNRTDWFAYEKDNYGTTRDLDKFTGRKYGAELVESLKSGYGGYATNNEVMFQRGISKHDVQQIFTGTEEKKQALIDALSAKGISEIGGKPLAEAIVVRTKMIEDDVVVPPAASTAAGKPAFFVASEAKKQELKQQLTAKGMTQVNGLALDQAIVVGEKPVA